MSLHISVCTVGEQVVTEHALVRLQQFPDIKVILKSWFCIVRLDSDILSIGVYIVDISSIYHFTSHYCGLHLTYEHFKDVVFLTLH